MWSPYPSRKRTNDTGRWGSWRRQRLKTGVSQTPAIPASAGLASANRTNGSGEDTIAGSSSVPAQVGSGNVTAQETDRPADHAARIYEYVTARTRVFDAYFSAALDEAVPQLVILGAGFDTRAWRFASRNRGTRIYELDSPVTQAMKKKLLAENGFPVPERLTFVPVDLEEQDLAAALERLVRPVKGVLKGEYHVSMRSVDRRCTRPGPARRRQAASFSTTCWLQSSGGRTASRRSRITRRVCKTGERWTFASSGGRRRFLADRGFELWPTTHGRLPRNYLRRRRPRTDASTRRTVSPCHRGNDMKKRKRE